MASISGFLSKALSPAYYQSQYKNFLVSSYNYYHPLFRTGSAVPLWHMMMGVSFIMYTTSYMARDYKVVQHRRDVQKIALKEYYEKHGGSADHH